MPSEDPMLIAVGDLPDLRADRLADDVAQAIIEKIESATVTFTDAEWDQLTEALVVEIEGAIRGLMLPARVCEEILDV